ncbi:hypothetical protein GTX14_17825 [Streptomyces sp. SID4944]|nr:hypothetical protein [Streptomyces sp. SID4944]
MTDRTGHTTASTSPRLDRFDAELARNPEAAVEALLTDLAAARGPIIEETEDGHDALVTFVYVDDVDQVELNTPALMLNAPASVSRCGARRGPTCGPWWPVSPAT